MDQSESIKELAGALAKAQAEMKAAEMTATNPFLKNKYADLGENIKASRPALTANGLSIIQPVSYAEGKVIITTQLMHASGEFIREVMAFPVNFEAKGKSAVQEAGSVITYLRRYSLSSMIGLYADEDTDGESKTPANGKAQKQPEAPAPAAPELTLTDAMAITNSEGKAYGDLTTEQLSGMLIGIGKGLKKPGLTIAERETYLTKKAAAELIIATRQQTTA